MSEVETMAETTFLPIRQLCREVELLKSDNEKLSAPRACELSAITDSCNAMPSTSAKALRRKSSCKSRKPHENAGLPQPD